MSTPLGDQPSMLVAGPDIEGYGQGTLQEASSAEAQGHAQSEDRPLFFADSDDEDVLPPEASLLANTRPQDDFIDLSEGVGTPQPNDTPRASSISSTYSIRGPRSSSPVVSETSDEPPAKKRKLSPLAHSAPSSAFESAYLGSFLVGNAWSTVRGTGYVKPGDEIRIERDTPDDRSSVEAKILPAKNVKSKGGKKQISIATMLKPQPVKLSKKKQDTVVRLTNKRGFGRSDLVSYTGLYSRPSGRVWTVASGCCFLGVQATRSW